MKTKLASMSAIGLLASGVGLSYLGFYTEPQGQISDSVLWYFAQTLIYAGSVLGIKQYVDYCLKKGGKE